MRSGVVVASTVAGAIDARDGGLAAGDVVYAVNRTPVAGLTELRAALDGLKTGDPVVLQLERRGELMYLAFTSSRVSDQSRRVDRGTAFTRYAEDGLRTA